MIIAVSLGLKTSRERPGEKMPSAEFAFGGGHLAPGEHFLFQPHASYGAKGWRCVQFSW
jgi:hypothetical protein